MTVERPVDAVQWHEGMLLAPQHFQQAALRGEGLVAYHAAAASPWHWGVIRLRLDETLLSGAGVVRVLELEAILPDGLVVQHDATLDEDLSLDLAPSRAALESGPLTLFLAVPTASGRPSSAAEARYRSVEGAPVIDANTGEDALPIPRLKPRLRLVAGPLPPARLIGLPILRASLRDETIRRARFLPPCLILPPASDLGLALSHIATRLREKAVFLAERARSPAASASEPLVLETQAVIRGLIAALPPLEALLSSGGATPFAVYLALVALSGQVASLGGGQIPPVPPVYRHDDLWACFLPLLEFVERRIDGVQMQYREVPFGREPGTFFLALKAAWLRPRLIVGARRQAGRDEASVVSWISRCMIASIDQIPSLADRRVLGARRQRIERDDELGVIPGERVTLFAIDVDPALIQTAAPLVITNRLDPDMETAPVELILYVPTGPADTGNGEVTG